MKKTATENFEIYVSAKTASVEAIVNAFETEYANCDVDVTVNADGTTDFVVEVENNVTVNCGETAGWDCPASEPEFIGFVSESDVYDFIHSVFAESEILDENVSGASVDELN